MKYKCLELALEETKMSGYVIHWGDEGCERVNPVLPSVIWKTILTFLCDT